MSFWINSCSESIELNFNSKQESSISILRFLCQKLLEIVVQTNLKYSFHFSVNLIAEIFLVLHKWEILLHMAFLSQIYVKTKWNILRLRQLNKHNSKFTITPFVLIDIQLTYTYHEHQKSIVLVLQISDRFNWRHCKTSVNKRL